MNLLERLPQADKEQIEAYIDNFADGYGSRRVGADTILQPWAAAKEDLYTLFGENFILKKNVSYKVDLSQMSREISDKMYSSCRSACSEFKYKVIETYADFLKEKGHNKAHPEGWTISYHNSYYVLNDAFNARTLANNKITLDDFDVSFITFYLPNDKIYKCQNGTKAIKLIGKIAEAFSIPGFEDFRLQHSLCLNQKELHGELCLSIHPLDYMTMSDNDCDWQSCMNWRNGGEYRQGTVEMMNSPMIVVAYLNADTPFQWCDKYSWTNKKWRCLFLVKNDYIMSVKSYPYHNKFLIQEVIDWLAGLFGNTNPEVLEYEPSEDITVRGYSVNINPHANAMYNDFGSAEAHYLCVHPHVNYDIHEAPCYSGLSECMLCGATYDYWDASESNLACEYCHPAPYCDHCECRLYDEDFYWVGDLRVCPDCINEYYFYDQISCEYVHREDGHEAHIRLSCGSADLGYYKCPTATYEREIYCNTENCSWSEYFNVPYEELHTDTYGRYATRDQLTDKGYSMFNLWAESDKKRFFDESEEN